MYGEQHSDGLFSIWARTNIVDGDWQEELFYANFCCQAEAFGVMWFLKTLGKRVGGFFYAAIANAVFLGLSLQLMMCPCVQKLPKKRRHFFELVGYGVFTIVALIVLALARPFMTLVIKHGKWKKACEIVVLTKLTSWTGVTFVNMVQFVVLFKIQCPKKSGDRFAWLDAPLDPDAQDERNVVVRLLNPRFHVLASEYKNHFGQWTL